MTNRRSFAGLSWFLVFTAPVITGLILPGCGPLEGVVVTEKQVTMTENMDKLKKDNRELRRRVSSIERNIVKANEVEKTKETLAGLALEIKAIRAETNSRLEGLRQDLKFAQGGLEESDYKRDQLREDIKSLKETLASLDKRLMEIETKTSEAGESLSVLKGAMVTIEQNEVTLRDALETVNAAVASLRATVNSLDEKTTNLDERVSTFDERARSVDERARSLEEKTRTLDERTLSLDDKIKKIKLRPVAKEKGDTPGPDPGALYMEGYRQIAKDNAYMKGIDTLKRFISLFPNHDLADNARYWMGEAYYATGDFERAVLEFDRVIKNYPDGDKVAAALLKQGFSFEKLDARKEAKVLLERVIADFPRSKEAEKAKKLLEKMK